MNPGRPRAQLGDELLGGASPAVLEHATTRLVRRRTEAEIAEHGAQVQAGAALDHHGRAAGEQLVDHGVRAS